MGQSRDTDFGNNPTGKSNVSKSGRLNMMMQELGETDPRLQDTAKSSQIMNPNFNNDRQNLILEKNYSPMIQVADSNQEYEDWAGTDYYANQYSKFKNANKTQQESQLSHLDSGSNYKNPNSTKKSQCINNSVKGNILDNPS